MKGEKFYGFANLGIAPAFLIDARTIAPTITFNEFVIPGETVVVTSRVNSFDLSGHVEFGGGYNFNNRFWLYTSFTYQHSFTSITNQDYFANDDLRHYGMMLNLGVKCALWK